MAALSYGNSHPVVVIHQLVVVVQEAGLRAFHHPAGARLAQHHPVARAEAFLVADAAHQRLGRHQHVLGLR